LSEPAQAKFFILIINILPNAFAAQLLRRKKHQNGPSDCLDFISPEIRLGEIQLTGS
jgi:hypothetical protein